MQKYLLLLCTCLVSFLSYAQGPFKASTHNHTASTEAPLPVVCGSAASVPATAPVVNNQSVAGPLAPHSGAKTTTALGRWYNFADYMLAPFQTYISKGTYYYGYSMWNDTTAWIGYTGGTTSYKRSENLSMALGLDPTYSSSTVTNYGWNTVGATVVYDFCGEMAITYADAYTIDSVHVPGWYTRTYAIPAKIAVVDTLILSFVSSPRTGTTLDLPGAVMSSPPAGYGVLFINYKELYHDITNNRGAHNGGGVLTAVYKFPLTSTDTTSDPEANVCVYPRRTSDSFIHFPVAANKIMVMTATFKSGDTSYHGSDTISYSDGTSITGYKYNHYAMEVAFATTTDTSTSLADVTWPFADNSNQSCGYFLFASGAWGAPGNKYTPQWNIFNGTTSAPTPSIAQYPRFAYHTMCNTCSRIFGCWLPGGVDKVNTISNVEVAPNPASNVLDISFTAQKAGATVTLTNSFGQQVASQVVAAGHASFNTADLAEGVYIYNIDAKDGKSSGRVVIAH